MINHWWPLRVTIPLWIPLCIDAPTTGQNVQASFADAPADDELTYVSLRCPACGRLHLVNRPTGRTLGTTAEAVIALTCEGGDQVRCPHRQKHENDWRIEDRGSLKPKKSWAHTVSIRHCDEKKHAGKGERYRAD
jgi:hypothetical protein